MNTFLLALISVPHLLQVREIMSSALYAEVPLGDPQSEIRLLTVFPSIFKNAPIKCHLHSVAIASPGEYEGLSYHWWGPIKNHISVNDIPTPVRKNLYNALIELRQAAKPRVLWVDAICIDQERNEENGEKSHQLHLMPQIYRKAQRTVAWFGVEPLNAEWAVVLNDFVERLLGIKQRLQQTEQWAAMVGTTAHYLDEGKRREHGVPRDDDDGWKFLRFLVTRSWAERVWVIQEAAVSQDTIIQCGRYFFNMEDIAIASSLMWTLGVKEATSMPTSFKSTWAECIKHKSGTQRTLLSLVIRHWLCDATMPHDKIYALCGLASDFGEDGLDIKFDYTKSGDEVYTEFAQAALKTYRNLDIFSALAPFHKDRSANLPSWVPDWRVFNNGTLIYRRPEPPPEPGPCLILFTAAKCTTAEPTFSEDGRRVRLHGLVLDTITEVGALRPMTSTIGESISHLVDWRNKIARCSRKKYAPTGQPMVNVFYHTTTMGNLSNFLADPLKEYDKFDQDLLSLAARWKDKSTDYIARELSNVQDAKVSWMNVRKSIVLSATRPCINRRLVRTKGGYLGLVHGQAQIGDHVALFRGGSLPLVIRKHGDAWRMVGDGYVHGVMMGEAFEDRKCQPFWFS
jgi:hypothetical protein